MRFAQRSHYGSLFPIYSHLFNILVRVIPRSSLLAVSTLSWDLPSTFAQSRSSGAYRSNDRTPMRPRSDSQINNAIPSLRYPAELSSCRPIRCSSTSRRLSVRIWLCLSGFIASRTFLRCTLFAIHRPALPRTSELLISSPVRPGSTVIGLFCFRPIRGKSSEDTEACDGDERMKIKSMRPISCRTLGECQTNELMRTRPRIDRIPDEPSTRPSASDECNSPVALPCTPVPRNELSSSIHLSVLITGPCIG